MKDVLDYGQGWNAKVLKCIKLLVKVNEVYLLFFQLFLTNSERPMEIPQGT